MNAPSITLRPLQNNETGIDISVPRFLEEEAPLGGTSILYEISVLTNLDIFKTRLHKNEDIVRFSIYKAYREIDDLFNKLNNKYPKAGLPAVPSVTTIDKYTPEEKLGALDKFMSAVSKNIELCHSSIFTKFIGINSQRLPSFSIPNTTPSNEDSCSVDKAESNKENNVKKDPSKDLVDVFPKVKAAPKPGQEVSTNVRVDDLFEEVNVVKDETDSPLLNKSSAGLFDEFDDESLFSSKPTPKPVTSVKKVEKKESVPIKKPEKKETPLEKVDDSQILIRDRKQGDISLFQEQDLGDYITKEEEALFLVTNENKVSKRKNDLLFSKSSETEDTVPELTENLDDLLNLEPIPALTKAEQQDDDKKSKPELDMKEMKEMTQTKKPVPLPRKKSLGNMDSESQNVPEIPQVMPRKVFLDKSDMSATSSAPPLTVPQAAKPLPISKKPTLAAKPKPPLKPKPVILQDKDRTKSSTTTKSSETNQSESSALKSSEVNQGTSIMSKSNENHSSADLNSLDILQYIEQQQKMLESEPSLFD